MEFYKVWHKKKNMKVINTHNNHETMGLYLTETYPIFDCVRYLNV